MNNQHCIKQDESDNLLDIVGMAIAEHLAVCEYLCDEDVPELLRNLANEWLVAQPNTKEVIDNV